MNLALTNNQVRIQSKNSDSFQTIVKALAEKRMEFHSYKPKKIKKLQCV
jgi:uncharacterized protein YajQ (UPF0234 family)